MKNIDDMVAQRPAVLGFVLQLVGDEALAQDVTQETFVRAQRAVKQHRGEASLKSWLCAIALNLVRDHFRTKARRPETSVDGEEIEKIPSPDDDAERGVLKDEMSNCIADFMAKLPPAQFEAVALHDLAGLSHSEVSVQLGISVANARVLVHRGRGALKEMLRDNCVLSIGSDDIPCERSTHRLDD